MTLSTLNKIRRLQRKLYTQAEQGLDADDGAVATGACLGGKQAL